MRRVLALLALVVLSACSNVETPSATSLPPSATGTAAPGPTTPPTIARPTDTAAPAATATQAAGFPDASAYQWRPVATGLTSPVDIQ
ncbi:MAG: hypothetical protein ACM3MF_02640, partial [Anaerolineae bacterium]